MMKQLLSKIPETRLGGSFASLYNHPWLAQIEWVRSGLFRKCF